MSSKTGLNNEAALWNEYVISHDNYFDKTNMHLLLFNLDILKKS